MSEIKVSFDSKVTFVKVPNDLLSKKLEMTVKVKNATSSMKTRVKSLFSPTSVKLSTEGTLTNLYLDPEYYAAHGVEEIEIYCKDCGVSVKRSFKEMERKLTALNGGHPVGKSDVLKVTYPCHCTCQLHTRSKSFYRFDFKE